MADTAPPALWHTCPACGNQTGFRGGLDAGGKSGWEQPLAFYDGHKNNRRWWRQLYRLDLTCACGHTWSLTRSVASDARQPVYEPYEPPPPPTPEEIARAERGHRCREGRLARHWSMADVALKLEATIGEISRFEHGALDNPMLAEHYESLLKEAADA